MRVRRGVGKFRSGNPLSFFLERVLLVLFVRMRDIEGRIRFDNKGRVKYVDLDGRSIIFLPRPRDERWGGKPAKSSARLSF